MMNMAHANGNGQHAGEGCAGSERDRRAAINMLPNADLSVHTCDSCSKDITGVRVERERESLSCQNPRHACLFLVREEYARCALALDRDASMWRAGIPGVLLGDVKMVCQ